MNIDQPGDRTIAEFPEPDYTRVRGAAAAAPRAPIPARTPLPEYRGADGPVVRRAAAPLPTQAERPASILDTLPDGDRLLEQRRVIVAQLRKLSALYGGTGFRGERVFKIREARAAKAIRATAKLEGEKVTEAMIDERTRTDPDYVSALLRDVARAAHYYDLKEQLNDIEWQLEIRKGDSYLLGGEARLT